ncbi:hypothetical protein [Acuticoccus mangrovi]|uniref:hypothetical protein n=1 Tax=Acuticoccus mangrovi TaxID=2796142 RepID=UPI001B3B9C3F|nr:hypothetical protein [Acuticoccus mangrovi]
MLAAHAGRRIDRCRLAALLWGEAEEALARASLRKALSLITAMPALNTVIGRDRSSLWFAHDPTTTDLATFNRCIAAGTERSYRDALTLWRGVPLQGLEVDEPLFDEWLDGFRADTVGLTHRLLSERLDVLIARSAAPALETALCELIARIEPADARANERLINLSAADGDAVTAKRRFQSYENALDTLDMKPPRALATFVENLGVTERQPRIAISRPTVALVRPSVTHAPSDLFSHAHSEVMHQLARFRSMRCFERNEPAPNRDGTLRTKIKIDDALNHDYRLLLWDEPKAHAIYLRCINARRQDTVSVVRLDYEELGQRTAAEARIAAAINSIEQDILSDEPLDATSPFSRWLEAYRLLQLLTPSSDSAAFDILTDLAQDPVGQRLSVVHSSISSILMLRRLLVPSEDESADRMLEDARSATFKALSLDELEPFNHIILGWLRVQAGEHERAIPAFEDAMRLNPYSSRTLISAAEANAYCGNIKKADALATRALELSGRYVPSYFHAYLANIAYLSGDLDGCLNSLQRAPSNVHAAILAVAAHQERGDRPAVAAALATFEREIRRAQPEAVIDGTSLSRWIVSSNMSCDPTARRRLFGALEQAGVPVGAAVC